jgi:hypothetical protein
MAKLITTPEDLITEFADSTSGIKIGVSFFTYLTNYTSGHFYMLLKMKEICNKTIMCIAGYSQNNTLLSGTGTDVPKDEVLSGLQNIIDDLPCDIVYYNENQSSVIIPIDSSLFPEPQPTGYFITTGLHHIDRHILYHKDITDLIRDGIEVIRFKSTSKLFSDSKFQSPNLRNFIGEKGKKVSELLDKYSKTYYIADFRDTLGYSPKFDNDKFISEESITYKNPYKSTFDIQTYNNLDDFKNEIINNCQGNTQCKFLSVNFSYDDTFKEATFSDLENGSLYVLLFHPGWWNPNFDRKEVYFNSPGEGFIVNFSLLDCLEFYPNRSIVRNFFKQDLIDFINEKLTSYTDVDSKQTTLKNDLLNYYKTIYG